MDTLLTVVNAICDGTSEAVGALPVYGPIFSQYVQWLCFFVLSFLGANAQV